MSIKKFELLSHTRALMFTLVCVGITAVSQQHAAASSSIGNRENSWVATSSDHSQSTAAENQDIHSVGGAVLPPKLVHAPSPKYTYAARRARLEGDCILELVVDAQGRPQDIQVKKALGKGLDQNAVKAVKKYRFNPATLNGKPVAVQIDINVHFCYFLND